MVLVLRNFGLGTDEICSLTPGTDELPWPATCDGVAEGEAVSWKRSLQLGIFRVLGQSIRDAGPHRD